MNKFFYIPFVFSVFLLPPAFSQTDSIDAQYSIADTLDENISLFKSDKLFDISLRFDITHFKKAKSDEEYLDAILTYHTSDKDSINKILKIRSRGNFRRTYCEFPPLLLNFRSTKSKAGEFSGLDKMKMVTHCKAGNDEYIFKEFLIYQLYNVLTDNSYKVRLLRINYINTSKKSKPIKEFGFVIEPTNHLEKRTHSVEANLTNLTQKNIKPEMMDRVAIFNYMIGNTDWSVPNQHNVMILSQPNSEIPGLGMIVPFDFDYSGLVNANYAIPYEELPIESVRDRLYLGICRREEVYKNALREFSDKKEEFFKVINEFPYLKEKSKKDMIFYLNEFFNGFDKQNTIVYKLLKDCKEF